MESAGISKVSAASPPASARGRAKACTACRQVKLKCDAKEVAPQPCSRCRASGLQCKIDQTFKRVPARQQLQEVSNRLNSLQRSLGLDQNPHLPASASLEDYIRHSRRPDDIRRAVPQSHFSDYTQTSSDLGFAPDGQSAGPLHFLELDSLDEQGVWQLGDVVLDANTIRVLFNHFNETHFRHTPFLEPCTSLLQYYQSSELLFWTVVLSSCFMYNDFHELHGRLLPYHRQLLSAKMLGERVSLRTIHAMLLMCTWTYPVSNQYDDLTWIICGTAVNMAMVMGLHKPGHVHEYAKDNQRHPGSTYTRNCTWLACFIISAGISAWLGMPPPLSASSHIEVIGTLCKDNSLPRRYRARADIQRRLVQLTTSLDSPRLDFRTRHSLIKIYEQELDDVQATFDDVWTDDLDIEWLGAKLYLFGIGFVSHGNNANSIETESPAVAAREVLQKGLAAAIGILDTISRMKLPPTARGANRTDSPDYIWQLAFYPKVHGSDPAINSGKLTSALQYYFRIGGFANFFLLWFLAVDAQASPADKELARTYITFTYRLMISFKQSPEHVRAGKAIEELARMSISSGQPSSLRVNTRLGASFMYSYTLDGAAIAEPKFQILPTLGAVGEGSGITPTQQMPPEETAVMGAPPLPPPTDAPTSIPLSSNGEVPPAMQVAVQPETIPMPDPQMQQYIPQHPPPPPPTSLEQVASYTMLEGGASVEAWDYPWAEWDPAAFNGLRMDVAGQKIPSEQGGMMQ